MGKPIVTRKNLPRSGARVPPHNLQAEESLLGAMLLARDAIAAASEQHLTPEDFYKPAHGLVYEACCDLYAEGEKVDPVTVADRLSRADSLEAIGGASILISLQAGTPAIGNAGRYAVIVKEHSLLRRLIGVAGEIAEVAYGLPDDISEAIDLCEAKLYEVAGRRLTSSTHEIRDVMGRYLDRLEALFERDEAITGLPSGFVELDVMTAGFQPGQLIIVGGRPSAGKTAFGLGCAAFAALTAGVPTAVFSLEMSESEVGQRLVSSESRVDSTRMRTGRLIEQDWSKISAGVGRLAEAPVYIDDNPGLTVMDIRGKARRMKSKGGLGFIIVDYLQLMSGRGTAENRQVALSEISRGLKILARELDVPVMAMSQLSRNLEGRTDKRPMLSDLKESGSLEQDADICLFIYRDEMYNPDSPDRGTAEIIVAKQRNGPTGTIRLAYLNHYTKFANMARSV